MTTSRSEQILALKAKTQGDESAFEFVDLTDPLDSRNGGWSKGRTMDPFKITAKDYGIAVPTDDSKKNVVDVYRSGKLAMDDGIAMDDSQGSSSVKSWNIQDSVSPGLIGWYAQQGFIGYQACALIAQHWLVDKACSMPGRDAIRNGYEVQTADGAELTPEVLDALSKADIKYGLKRNCVEFVRNTNIFGIRICIMEFDLEKIGDELFYEKPFDPDSITEGSYLGISQVDPYWTAPLLGSKSSGSPAYRDFYVPEYWIISGRKYHKSHLIVGKTDEPADVLKPTYVFGGIPLTQKIYERIYAAERTANEAPLLAMTKRTTAIHVDLKKALLNQGAFDERIAQWVGYRDNQGVRVLGTEETMEQIDTSLADLDAVIMSQYQLVAAIGEVPATKLLGTSPKGFGASGEYELASYHERLETIQESTSPLVDRHHMCVIRSEIMHKFSMKVFATEVVWKPVDSMSAEKLANVNKTKADTGLVLIQAGAISADDERQRVRNDKESGYTGLTDEAADTTLEPRSPDMASSVATEVKEMGAGGEEDPLAGMKAISGGEEDPVADLKKLSGGDADPVDGLRKIAGGSTDDISTPQSDPIADLTAIASGGTSAQSLQKLASIAEDVNLHQSAQLRSSLPQILVQELPVVIENRTGSIRSGENENGPWRTRMPFDYGFIDKIPGADGDDLDAFIGPNPDGARSVFVINQINALTGEFDECKCMLGFDDQDTALKAYMDSYSDNYGSKIFKDMHELTVDEFKDWITSGKTLGEFESVEEPESGGGFGIAALIESDPSQKTVLNTEGSGGESATETAEKVMPPEDDLAGPKHDNT